MYACMYVCMHACMHAYINTLHFISFHYITLHYITLYCTTLHYITLHYITLHICVYIYIYIYPRPRRRGRGPRPRAPGTPDGVVVIGCSLCLVVLSIVVRLFRFIRVLHFTCYCLAYAISWHSWRSSESGIAASTRTALSRLSTSSAEVKSERPPSAQGPHLTT